MLNGNVSGGGETGHRDFASTDPIGGAEIPNRLVAETDALRRDWHLARVWLGPHGGGAIVAGVRRRPMRPSAAGAKTLLTARGGDERLEVADPAMFVGRKRELQQSLRMLRDHGGLLVHGMGRLGKSSLAARIAARRSDLKLVVIYAHYDALSVVDALRQALEEHRPARDLINSRWPLVRDDRSGGATALRMLLVDLLAGPCAEAAAAGRPVLLLADDLERLLEPRSSGRHVVRLSERPVIAALLHAFTPERGDSRLLFTSRFPFTLSEGGRNLAANAAARAVRCRSRHQPGSRPSECLCRQSVGP